MSIYGNIVRHSATYSVAVILRRAASVLLLPVYTRYLTPADYGVMELLDITTFVLSALIGIRLTDALLYFYSQAGTEQEKARTVQTAFWGAHLAGVLGALAGWFSAAPVSMLVFGGTQYEFFFRLVFLNFAFVLPQEIGYGYLRATNRPSTYVATNLLGLVITVALNLVLLVGYDMGVAAILWSNLTGSVTLSVVLGAYLLRQLPFSFDFRLLARQFRYSAPLGISALGMTIIHSGDRFFLQRAAPLSEVGLYALGYKIGMLVAYVQLPFITYWHSQMFHIVREPGGERTYARVCTYFTLALAAAAVVLSVFSAPMMKILAAPAYQQAALLVPAIAAAYVVRGAGDYFRNVFAIHNRTSLNVKVTLGGVITTLICYAALIPAFHSWGAAAATGITFVVMGALALREAQKVRAHAFEWRRLAQIGCASGISIAVALLLRPPSLAGQLALGAACTLLFPALLVALRFFHSSELDVIRSQWQALRRRIQVAGAS